MSFFFFLSKVSIEGKQAVRYPDEEVFNASGLTIARRMHPEELNVGLETNKGPPDNSRAGPSEEVNPS